MRDLKTAVFVGLVALAAMAVGCGDAGESGERAAVAGAEANASTPPDAGRAEGRIAYKVSGMMKTASGAT